MFQINATLKSQQNIFIINNSITKLSVNIQDTFVSWLDNNIIPTMSYNNILANRKYFNVSNAKLIAEFSVIGYPSQGFVGTFELSIILTNRSPQNFHTNIVSPILNNSYSFSISDLILPDISINIVGFNNSIFYEFIFILTIQLDFTISISCDPRSQNIFCSNLCSCIISKNIDTCSICLNNYINECFKGTNNFNENCFNFFQNFMFFKGPNPQLDNLFYNYCKNKYTLLQDMINDPVCSCHLDSSVYQNIFDNLKQRFNNLEKVYNPKDLRCILPQCANSNFPHTDIGITKCQGVRCINIVDVSGNNINYDKITINQSGTCINLCSKNLKC